MDLYNQYFLLLSEIVEEIKPVAKPEFGGENINPDNNLYILNQKI